MPNIKIIHLERHLDATERTRFSKSRPNDLEDIGQGQGSSHATHPLMLLIICSKYGKNPSWTVDATGRTRKFTCHWRWQLYISLPLGWGCWDGVGGGGGVTPKQFSQGCVAPVFDQIPLGKDNSVKKKKNTLWLSTISWPWAHFYVSLWNFSRNIPWVKLIFRKQTIILPPNANF